MSKLSELFTSKRSKDIVDEVDVLNELLAMATEKDIRDFIKGDDRDSVMDAAMARINELLQKAQPKQGEQPGPITQQTSEFKSSGVEGTKVITGDDVIDSLDEAAEKKASAIAEQDEAEDARKETEAAAKEKTYITGEDVIRSLRAKGHRI